MQNVSVSGKHRYGGGTSSMKRGCKVFLSPRRGEVSIMYVTWELLFLFVELILIFLTYMDNHNSKKK